jgi:hypothetical protein
MFTEKNVKWACDDLGTFRRRLLLHECIRDDFVYAFKRVKEVLNAQTMSIDVLIRKGEYDIVFYMDNKRDIPTPIITFKVSAADHVFEYDCLFYIDIHGTYAVSSTHRPKVLSSHSFSWAWCIKKNEFIVSEYHIHIPMGLYDTGENIGVFECHINDSSV